MTDDDIAYYRRRADDERRRAEETADPAIALAHRQLADRYDQLLKLNESIAGDRPLLALVG